jgi:hypothetical protein
MITVWMPSLLALMNECFLFVVGAAARAGAAGYACLDVKLACRSLQLRQNSNVRNMRVAARTQANVAQW